MPADPPRHTPPDKLSVVVFSGLFDKVHFALVMATAAEPTMNSNIDRMNSRRWPQMSDSLPMSGMAAT